MQKPYVADKCFCTEVSNWHDILLLSSKLSKLYDINVKQEAQLMLTTGSTRLAVSRGQQTWYHSTCYI